MPASEEGVVLDPALTFESFVVDPANHLAFVAAKRAAEAPGAGYNPLYLHSGAGLGKSHLISAIAHRLRLNRPGSRIVHLDGAQLLEEIDAESESDSRGSLLLVGESEPDILLIDDVQLLFELRDLVEQSGILERIVTAFTSLTERRGQVVLAADRPPSELGELDPRLGPWLAGGLSLDLGAPGPAARVAILQGRAEDRKGGLEGQDGEARIDPEWKRAVRIVVESARERGYAPEGLAQILDAEEEPEGWRERLQAFEVALERLERIDREVEGLTAEGTEVSVSPPRDPDRVDEAEAMVASAKERARPLPQVPEGERLAELRGRYPPLALESARRLVLEDRLEYNPLFVHSPSADRVRGFLEAVAREVQSSRPGLAPGLLSVERLAGELSRARVAGVLAAWRARWAAVDVLLVHGLEELPEVEGGQAEFFELFEAIRRRKGRILLGADRPPSEVVELIGRLRSRFGGGLVAGLGMGAGPDGDGPYAKWAWIPSPGKVVWDWPRLEDRIPDFDDETRGQGVIEGRLEESGLVDVCQLLALGRRTGCLTLSDGSNFGYLYFDRGRVVYSAVSTRTDRLGELLVQEGAVDRRALSAALEAQAHRPGRRVGEIFVKRGDLSEEELSRVLRAQVEETAYSFFGWRRGSFRFEPEAAPGPATGPLVSITPEQLLLEGARRVEEWSAIRKRIPALDLVFVRVGEMRADPGERGRRILALLDGERTVADVVRESGLGELETTRALYGLVQSGAVREVSGRASSGERPELPEEVGRRLSLAHAFYRARMWDEAEREYRRVAETDAVPARSRLARIALRRGDAEGALAHLDGGPPRTVPDSTDLRLRALALEWLRRYGEGLEVLNEVARIQPEDGRILLERAVLTLKAGRPDEALEHFERFGRGWSNDEPLPEIAFAFGLLAHAAAGDSETAFEVGKEGLAAHPGSGALLVNLGAVLEHGGELDGAEALQLRAAALDDPPPHAHRNLGDLAGLRGDPEAAREHFERARALWREALERRPHDRTAAARLAELVSFLEA